MKRLNMICALMVLMGSFIFAPAAVFAAQTPAGGSSKDDSSQSSSLDPTQTACSAIGGSDCTDKSGGPGLNGVVKAIINILSLVVGIASVIMIIVGGLRYVISNGDATAITGAKNTILYAIVGLIVVALAQFIVQFVLGKVT